MNQGMTDFTEELQAGFDYRIPVDGNYFQVRQASSPVQLSFDGSDYIEREQGEGGPRTDYKTVIIRSAVAQTVTVALGMAVGGPYDNRTVFAGAVSAVFDVANDLPGIAEVTIGAGLTVPLVAADPERLSLRIHVPSSAAEAETEGDPARIYVASPGTVADGVGALIEAGVAERIGGSGALSAHNPTDQPLTVNLLASRAVA